MGADMAGMMARFADAVYMRWLCAKRWLSEATAVTRKSFAAWVPNRRWFRG